MSCTGEGQRLPSSSLWCKQQKGPNRHATEAESAMFIVAARSGLVAAVARSIGSGFLPSILACLEGATRTRESRGIGIA